jgi:tRNA(fMet)-specific endonuclease VapC
MRPITLHTNTDVGFKRGDADCIEVVRPAGRLLLGITVIGELLAGFAWGERERRNREELSLFLASPRVESPPAHPIQPGHR